MTEQVKTVVIVVLAMALAIRLVFDLAAWLKEERLHQKPVGSIAVRYAYDLANAPKGAETKAELMRLAEAGQLWNMPFNRLATVAEVRHMIAGGKFDYLTGEPVGQLAPVPMRDPPLSSDVSVPIGPGPILPRSTDAGSPVSTAGVTAVDLPEEEKPESWAADYLGRLIKDPHRAGDLKFATFWFNCAMTIARRAGHRQGLEEGYRNGRLEGEATGFEAGHRRGWNEATPKSYEGTGA